ncbi:hypothetical protein [Actinacidiphila sp. ITFR-21]|uniref:hypothetical protein n=1 Tax=Actinacidiphila sp. ITFR-21 TaxID=3075199 RepID=UPI00288923BA|nr:hypothetical protein [Streptomyces sp. ITFR-21]WNI20036.1 hypothetical protein RLT57_31350 [Streptomyces sp. ITFR-21]
MSTKDFIASAGRAVGADAPVGARARAELARFLALAAEDDGHLPEEPEARRCAVRIADALEQDRAEEEAGTAWSRLNELHRRQRETAVQVASDLAGALRAMYPAAYALVLAEDDGGSFRPARLISAGGRTVRDLVTDTSPLPPMPARLRDRWPAGALEGVNGLVEVVSTLAACGLGFDDLPSEVRGENDCHHSHIPALLLDEGCEYGC